MFQHASKILLRVCLKVKGHQTHPIFDRSVQNEVSAKALCIKMKRFITILCTLGVFSLAHGKAVPDASPEAEAAPQPEAQLPYNAVRYQNDMELMGIAVCTGS